MKESIFKYFLKKYQMRKKPAVGIVITSYNHIDYTDRALESFYATVNTMIDHEVWLLDDHSSENVVSVYEKYRKFGLKLFKNRTNAGLTNLWNKGFELNRNKKYLILCNNDVIFSNHWADHLIGHLRRSFFYSVAVPVTNAPGHVPEQQVKNFLKSYVLSDDQMHVNLTAEQVKNLTPQEIKKGNGFCLAMKISLLSHHLINGFPFNEKFPLYGGEGEFFARVKPKTMLVPSSFIFHYKHVSVDSHNFPEQIFRKT